MAISKTKNYMVLNYNSSPVGISTKHESYIVRGGSLESPGALPLTFDEIAVVNSTSPAFKIGLLSFEEKDREEMYEALSIPNWKDILTLERIEEILMHPTMEELERILAIDNVAYFERIRGVLMGLKNAGFDVSNQVDKIIEQRRRELANRQRKTAIKLVARDKDAEGPSKEEFDSMKSELEAMRQMMQKLLESQTSGNAEPAEFTEKKTSNRRTKEKANDAQ